MKKLIGLGLVLVMVVLATSSVMAEEAKKGSWGVGLGIPYGIIGFNIDRNIIQNIDLSLGLGVCEDGFAYNAGAKIYLASAEKRFRPRISCYYGKNTVVHIRDYYYGVHVDDEYFSHKGVTAGLGASIVFGAARRNGMDFDLLYIVSNDVDLDEYKAKGYYLEDDDTHTIKLSVGYRHYF